ncbi:tyrosine-type recombinase/integrase [Pseudogemmobacter bohemicus]|uniref:tyrosine-type recombinase/integrase n=1 Tax=Pseudogemmobacter bohemicus TaxID=2250708 RepID=UPI00130057C8|nr:tyrosine-type recombinase/integrase [Pseudogemmobacter bohemicus]
MKLLRKPPRYCQGFEDRHGTFRWYYRRPGFPRCALPGLPWTPEFMAAYEKAANGEKLEIGVKQTIAGSVSALVVSFYKTSDFTGLSDSTKATYRGIIERFRAEHGDKRVAHMERKHLQKLVSDKAATPAAANNMLRMVHLLMRHAVELGWRGDDPTQGVRKVRNKTEGFLTWEEDHIAAFEEHHKPGTRAHLALMLLLYTGQRRSDVVRMGRQHVRKGILSITQQKTGQDVHIPLHADLRAVLDALPLDNLSFLMTAQGHPFTPPGFTNWFRAMVREAGLPDGLSPHGLRKATCRRLAEAGCSEHQIMAISGHRSTAEVNRYTRAASRKELAAQGMLALERKEG